MDISTNYLIKLVLVSIFLLLSACGGSSSDPDSQSGGGGIVIKGNPEILYTDLVTGPVGSFVTVWGHNIPENATFTCGNEPCQIEIPLAIDANHPAHGVLGTRQKMVFQFNAGSDITLDGYNTLPFTVNGGQIWEITPSDSIPDTMDQMSPGDVLYLRGGVYSQIDTSYGTETIIWVNENRDGLAVIGYPGETVVLDLDNNGSGILGFDTVEDISNWTIANMECAGTGNITTSGNNGRCVQASRIGTRTNLRVVNMYNHGTGINGGSAFGVFGNTRGLHVLGNFTENTGTSSGLTHAIYHGGRGTNDNVNFEFNRVGRHEGRRGFQIYGHTAGENLTNLRIRYNHVYDQGSNGILVSHTDGLSGDPQTRCWISDALVEGNTVENTASAAIRFLGCDVDVAGDQDFIARNNFVEGDIVADFPTEVIFQDNCALSYRGSYTDLGGNETSYPACLP